MKHRLYSLCQKVVSPVTDNFVFLIIICGLLLIPIVLQCIQANDALYFAYAFPINAILAYMISALEFYGRKYMHLRVVCCVVIGLFSVFESFLVYSFGTPFSATILSVILETNADEAGGFVTSYLLTAKFALFVLVAILVVACVVAVDRFGKRLKICCLNHLLTVGMASIVILSCVCYVARDIRFSRFFTIRDTQQVIHDKNLAFYAHNYTVIGNFIFQCYLYSLESNHTQYLKNFVHQGVSVASMQKSPLVIAVIGEALNKYHLSLYGYSLNTNPILLQERNSGNLYTFLEVVSSYNTTIKSLRALLFTASNDTDEQWSMTPCFPYLFKQAGHKVYFISNQEVVGGDSDQWDFGNNYLVNPNISPYYFDYQNPAKHSMDMDLVKSYSPQIDGEASLILYHLMGQHAAYADRYPHEEAAFSAGDYLGELSKWQQETMAHYDNSIRYNDKVVGEIINRYRNHDCILVYFSDHGEECYDYRAFAGRDLSEELTPERAKYQFEVPFMIWMSDKYKENHPDVVAQVERSIDRPYMIDDLPHLMLDLAGIECEWFDPTRSVINDKFNVNRKRLLLDSKQDYDEIMKGAK